MLNAKRKAVSGILMALLLMSFLTPLFNIQPTEGAPTEPVLEWEKTFGETSGDYRNYGRSVQVTGDSGYIIAGGISSFGAGRLDVYLVKTDSDGNLMWEKTFGGIFDNSGYSVQMTGDGGYIITGYTHSSKWGGSDVYLVKTDSDGNLMWEKTFGEIDDYGRSKDDYGRSVQVTGDGGYIITGNTYYDMTGDYDVYLVKADSRGNLEWSITFGGAVGDYGYSVQVTGDGGYIIAGGTASFGAGATDVYLVKTDSDGNLMWEKTFGRIGSDMGYSVQVTGDGGYIITGYTGIGGGVYLVRARVATLPVSISVSPFGAFITTRVADTASLPLRVETSRGGQPVSGARVFTADGSLILGITDANGVVEATYPIAHPPTAEDFTISIMAEVNSITFSSDPITLYSSSWLGGGVYTLTENEAQWYSLFLLLKYAAQPGIPVPGPWGLVLTMIDLLARLVYDLSVYEAQAGDDITYELYEYTSPGVETAYCYMEKVERSGQEIYNRIWWTNDYSLVKPYDVQDLQRAAIVGTLASPATLYITDPDGRHAGVDPSTGEEVFEFPVAMEEDNDGHLWLIIPAPLIGDYTFTIIGTGEGTYSLTLQTVDTTGYTMEEQVVSAAVAVGVTHDYSVAYSPDQVLPLTITLLASIDFDPDTLNLKSKGKWVTAYIELPEGYDVNQIDVSSILLNDMFPAIDKPTEIGDYDDDGITDLMVKFDRQLLIEYLKVQEYGDGDMVELTVTGEAAGTRFEGFDTIRAIREKVN